MLPQTILTTLTLATLTLASSHTLKGGPNHGLRRNSHNKRSSNLSPRELYEARALEARAAAGGEGPLVVKRSAKSCKTRSKTVTAASTTPVASATGVVNLAVKKTSTSAPPPAATTTKASVSTSNWKLNTEMSGNTFFDKWDFWTYDDPTHGTVDYIGASEAWNSGIISITSNGHAKFGIDTTNKVSGRGRKSIRLHSKLIFNGGLLIADIVAMPVGCGTWPAWWANGPNWPNGGEIDILEGVNAFTQNQVSIHTGDGCRISKNYGATAELTTGNFDNLNCASYATQNQGCGQRAVSTPNAYGTSFNNNGGGVYAMKWDHSGISVFFFPRNSIPSDISSGSPTPESWGTPMGNFPSESCDPYKYFTDNIAIFTNTFCGDWGAGAWNYADAGQTQSCAASTGYASCSDYVMNNGAKLTNAFWEVASIKYYKSS